jgi:hypothetical protein
MDFLVETHLTQPAERVVRAFMDELERVTPYMKSVDDVHTVERDQGEGDAQRIIRKWQGSAMSSPAVLRPFLTKESLSWLDDALWFPSEYRVEWNVTSSMSRLYTCGGTNYFEPHPEHPDEWTRVRLTGKIQIHPDKFPGVPTFLARKLAPALERFIVKKFEPNFRDLAAGLQRYFDDGA